MKSFFKDYSNILKSAILKKVYKSLYRPGHYYSPIPSLDEIRKREATIFDTNVREIGAVDLNEKGQLRLLKELKNYVLDFPFSAGGDETGALRYNSDNGFFNKSDAFYLYAILRHFKPQQLIEVGSGYSSAVILDTNNHFLGDELNCIFIEPFPNRLKSLLKKDDKGYLILEKKVQDTPLDMFAQLNADDILFIDSSHISKVGSDLNFILFQILPVLKSGVIVHFHDICYPFEYPKDWIIDGIHWNEAYLLHSFLMYNDKFEIILFNHYLSLHHQEWLESNLKEVRMSGGSLWLRKK